MVWLELVLVGVLANDVELVDVWVESVVVFVTVVVVVVVDLLVVVVVALVVDVVFVVVHLKNLSAQHAQPLQYH